MYEDKLKVNLNVNVEYNDENYSSNIQNINLKKKYIEISIPIKNGKYVPLHRGEEVYITFFDEDNLYRFLGSVIGNRKDTIPLIVIKYPDNIHKIQRRKFVRVKKLKEIKYIKLNSNISNYGFEFFSNNKEKIKNAYTIDISGGGCRINANEKLEYGDIILVCMDLSNAKVLIKSKVVRIDENNNYGIEFIDIEENVREKIIMYLFKIMREMRRKSIT